MGFLDVLKKKQAAGSAELPPPPPPPTKGLELDLPEAPTLPPLPEAPMPEEHYAEPEIPAVASEEPPVIMQPPQPEETGFSSLPPLQDLEEPLVMEPTVSSPLRIVSGTEVKPMFISIEDYQEILNNIGAIKDSLHDTEGAMNRLNELKNAQERILEDWRTHIEDAERKITYIDQVIFRGE